MKANYIKYYGYVYLTTNLVNGKVYVGKRKGIFDQKYLGSGVLLKRGCNYEMCNRVLETLKECEWSADNLAFGMGGALLQNLNRDTQRFAFKCSAILKDNEWHPVFKCPIEDLGKISKAGKLKLQLLENGSGKFSYHTVADSVDTTKDQLVEVFRNGKILKEYTFDDVRKNAEIKKEDKC